MKDELLDRLNDVVERLLVSINELNKTTKGLDNTLKIINDEYNHSSKEQEINLMNGGL